MLHKHLLFRVCLPLCSRTTGHSNAGKKKGEKNKLKQNYIFKVQTNKQQGSRK